VGFVLALGIVSGALADSVSFFIPDPGAPVSVCNSGMSIAISWSFTPLIYLQVTNGIITYLLGCNNASASATGHSNFTAPITMTEGPRTFHAEVATWLKSN
jgi:hypothetical protein